jgi:hypothetical protein
MGGLKDGERISDLIFLSTGKLKRRQFDSKFFRIYAFFEIFTADDYGIWHHRLTKKAECRRTSTLALHFSLEKQHRSISKNGSIRELLS